MVGEGGGVDGHPVLGIALGLEGDQVDALPPEVRDGGQRPVPAQLPVQGQQAAHLAQASRSQEAEGGLERAVRPDPAVRPRGERGLQQRGAVPAATVSGVDHALDGAVGEDPGVADGRRGILGGLGVVGEEQQVAGILPGEREAACLVERGDPVVAGDRLEQGEHGAALRSGQNIRGEHEVLLEILGGMEQRRPSALVDCLL